MRLPPFLLVCLQRFRSVDGVPTKVGRHCRIDMQLELEEAANCVLRAVAFELCSVVCHYGEATDGGTYKALARHGGSRRGSALAASPSCASGNTANLAGGNNGNWFVFDDTAVRLKPMDELGEVMQCAGYHVCFLMYRREDTKTINIRPHSV